MFFLVDPLVVGEFHRQPVSSVWLGFGVGTMDVNSASVWSCLGSRKFYFVLSGVVLLFILCLCFVSSGPLSSFLEKTCL